MENRFNLIDEPWIPIADVGLVSLKEIFSNPSLRALGGNPVQKIAITKLLLAIAQSACTPKNDADWQRLGWQGVADKCLSYLHHWHERFYLYGEQPFLQMPSITEAKVRSLGALSPEVSTGNTTVLTQSQVEQQTSDAECAQLIVNQMAFGLGGKKTDNSVVLSAGYTGKRNSTGTIGSVGAGKAGSAVGSEGLLHSFWLSESVVATLWLNLLTAENIANLVMYPQLGTAPWEQMPSGEDDETARALKQSLMGRLVPLGKFCLLADNGIHYTDGIVHAGYLEGKADPTVSIDFSAKKPKALWVNPNKRPWRELTALLQFTQQGSASGFETLQLQHTVRRISRLDQPFAIWSGGLKVSSSKHGEQGVKGTDDYVQSEIWLSADPQDEQFFEQLQQQMTALEAVQKQLYVAVVRYHRELCKAGNSKVQPFSSSMADQATHLFWQLCERHAQMLIDSCEADAATETRHALRRTFADYATHVFDKTCPNDSARQMDAWAQSRPNFSSYINAE